MGPVGPAEAWETERLCDSLLTLGGDGQALCARREQERARPAVA